MRAPSCKRLVAALICALAACAALAATAAASDPGVVAIAEPQSPEQIRAFWTPERMREAQPLQLPQTSGAPIANGPTRATGGRAMRVPPSRGVAAYDFEPEAETSFPQSVHGKVFFTVPGVGLGACSGTVVSSRLQNVVFTAGHCAQLPGESPATDMVFVPGYRDGAEPFGEYPVTTLLTTGEWVRDADFSYDVAIAQLASPIEKTLGARGIAFNKPPKTEYRIYGYPAEPSPTYDGERLIECNAPFYGLELGPSHPFSTVVYPCAMQQGSSGGGWVDPAGNVVSVVSHGYEDPSLVDQLVGPYFGDAVKRLYNRAGGSAQCPPARGALRKARKLAAKARRSARRSSSRRSRQRLHKANRRLGKARHRRDSYC